MSTLVQHRGGDRWTLAARRDGLRKTIQELLSAQPDDRRLRDHLEGLRRDTALPGLTWFWGPELYRRNRVVFREFILAHFAEWDLSQGTWKRIPWAEHADRLDPWLVEVRKHRDTALIRRLFTWKFRGDRWQPHNEPWSSELLREYQAARGAAAQARVLEEFEGWYQLDEAAAETLYATNRACRGFLLKHLPLSFSFWFWGKEKREPWRRLMAAAHAAGDEDLEFKLYRRQMDVKEWRRDVERLAEEIPDADRLNDELRKRHPEGYGLKLSDGVLPLLERRGRDVFPYVRDKLQTIVGGWHAGDPEAFLDLARKKGWWDLWAAVIRSASQSKHFDQAVAGLLDDRTLDEATRVERLKALAGVSREWNWPGFGMARVHTLDDDLATRLYQRYPDLIRGPYKPHVVPRWWAGGPKLLAAAQAAGDDELVDLLASRYVTRATWSGWYGKRGDEVVAAAEKLAETYQAMRDKDPAAFARRAGNILTQVPAYAISNFNQTLRSNALARLLFVRSSAEFLAFPTAVRDLVEGSEIHVQSLAYRILAQDDDRARMLAVETLDILLGTLLRPLQRRTRLAAFGALANAARGDADAAARVLGRARDALLLPDKKYPKEELIGLIGTILHRRPELRGPRERPVVYTRAEAAV